jgi:hypothetical protein
MDEICSRFERRQTAAGPDGPGVLSLVLAEIALKISKIDARTSDDEINASRAAF